MSGCPPAQCRASLQGGLTEGLHQVTPRGFHPRKGGVTSSERSRQVSSHLLGGCCRQVGVHLHHQIPPPLERKTALGSPTALSHPHLFNFSLPSKQTVSVTNEGGLEAISKPPPIPENQLCSSKPRSQIQMPTRARYATNKPRGSG